MDCQKEDNSERFQKIMDFFYTEFIQKNKREEKYYLSKNGSYAYLWKNLEDRSEKMVEFEIGSEGKIYKQIHSTPPELPELIQFFAQYGIKIKT